MCNTLTTLETLASRLVCPVPGLHPPTVRNLNLVLGWNQRVWDKVSSVSRAFFDVIALHLRLCQIRSYLSLSNKTINTA